MDSKEFYLVTSIDTDEDNFDRRSLESTTLTWRGVEEGIPGIIEGIRDIRDAAGMLVRYTWFIRCDEQLNRLFGSNVYLLEKYNDLWKSREKAGDEIAWHFHPFDHGPDASGSGMSLVEMLKRDYRSAVSKGFNIISSRIGRAFCTNSILTALQDIGIKIDSSALPGRKRKDEINNIDWEKTPKTPYFPSQADYREPGSNHLDLLEVPMSMIGIKASYDDRPISRYANLAFKNDVIGNALKKYVRENDLLVSIMHPSETMPLSEHPLISFDLEEVKKNLEAVISACRECSKSIRFVTIAEVLGMAKKGVINVAR